MGRECGLSRLWKDVGEGEAGPLAADNLWVGSDVHIDIPGGGRRNRKRPGIAAAPSVHKAADCPDGEHRHDQFDYCHPEERKHRGQGKPEEKRPYPPSRTIQQRSNAAFSEWRKQGSAAPELYERYKQLRELYSLAREWEASPEGEEWVTREKVKRAKGQGLKSREHYEAKAKELQARFDQLHEEHDNIYVHYRAAASWKERQPYIEKLTENVKRQEAVRAGIVRAKSMATLGFAREWTGIIQQIAGGVEPQISAIRTGSRAFAHYSLDTGIIGISDRALELLEKVRNDPDILWKKGPNLRPDRYTFAVSTLVHEFLHSVNSAKGVYMKGAVSEMIEEGLTEAIANRMVARPDVLSKLLGTEVGQGIVAKPEVAEYIVYTNTMEYMAERAAQKSNSEPEWFLGKWKFHTDPKTRGEIILDDAGMSAEEGYSTMPWRGIMREAKEKLPQMKEERLAQRMSKSFQDTVQKVLDSAWSVLGFVFKNDTWPPATPAPTGGGGGNVASGGGRGGSLVPSNMDVRHTGSPPKGVRWQKLPRQGGAAIGGAGAGAIEAGRTYLKPDQRAPEGTQEEVGPRGGRYYESEGAAWSDVPVYHGTTPEDAEAIEQIGFVDKPARWPDKNTGLGFFFTTSRDEANEFATKYGAEVGDIIEAEVSLKNPFIEETSWAELAEEVGAWLGLAEDEYGVQQAANGVMVKQVLQKKGYDGIVFERYQRRWIVAFEEDTINVTGIAKSAGTRIYLVYPAGLERGSRVKAGAGAIQGAMKKHARHDQRTHGKLSAPTLVRSNRRGIAFEAEGAVANYRIAGKQGSYVLTTKTKFKELGPTTYWRRSGIFRNLTDLKAKIADMERPRTVAELVARGVSADRAKRAVAAHRRAVIDKSCEKC